MYSSSLAPDNESKLHYDIHWVNSIDDIETDIWNQCFDKEDVLQSFELQKATEEANLESVNFNYLIMKSDDVTIAIIPCFRFNLNLTVTASPKAKGFVAKIRKLFPSFLYMDTFVIGTPVAICQDLFGVNKKTDDVELNKILSTAFDAAIERANELKIGLVLIKEVTSRLLPRIRNSLENQFTIAESPATTYLYLGEPGSDNYRSRLRYKYRSVMNGRLRNFNDAGLHWEVHQDFSKYAKEMHSLYLQVLNKSNIRFEELTPDFFSNVSTQLGENSFALLCFDGKRIVACELFLKSKDNVYPIYLGMDYNYRDKASLYFNCIYKIIDVVEDEGKPVVQLGQTSYVTKSGFGAVVDRLYVGVRHRNSLLNHLILRFRDVLFKPTDIPRQKRVFRDIEENNNALRKHNIPFEECMGE